MIAQPSQVKIRSLPRHLKASIIHCTQFLLTSLLLHAPALEPIYLLFSPSAVLLPRYLHGLLPPPAHALIQRRLLSLPDLNLPDSSSLSYTDSHYLASLFILLHCPLGQFTFYFIISFFFIIYLFLLGYYIPPRHRFCMFNSFPHAQRLEQSLLNGRYSNIVA